MGFYLRKSISAGPFRFNLSGSGVGMSVGVKGFRVGTGPRGNYIHMGRGGLYYRASLGGPGSSARRASQHTTVVEQPAPVTPGSIVETGNVLEMKPANGSQILEQVNEKLRLHSFWPWSLIGGGVIGLLLISQPNGTPIGLSVIGLGAALSVFLGYCDKQRKTVVIMYDLDDDAVMPFRRFTEEFDKLRLANRIWNVDTAERTSDWKRNAGASHLLNRKTANLTYTAPTVVKTNLSIPAILGGRQNIHFFPDVILVVEGSRAGALSYDQLEVLWTTTVFIENDGVPADAKVVGYTWRFVNKDGGPDRRFNNNRQIPKALYLQMGLTSTEGLRKILQFSKLLDHTSFDDALGGLRGLIRKLKLLMLEAPKDHAPNNLSTAPPPTLPSAPFVVSDTAAEIGKTKPEFWEFKLTVELLRANVGPIAEKWHNLSDGKYTKRLGDVPLHGVLDWLQGQVQTLPKLCERFSSLVNQQLPASWGPSGQPGDADAITKVCEELTLCAKQVLDWEETVHFTALPKEFSEVQNLLCGIAGPILLEISRIADEIARIIAQPNISGKFNIQLTVSVPDGWPERYDAALQRAAKASGLLPA